MATIEKLEGRLACARTGHPLAHVDLVAYDRDLFTSDTLGETQTDAWGRFDLSFPRTAYSHGGVLGESAPDVYLVVTNPLTGEREVRAPEARGRGRLRLGGGLDR